MTAAATAPVITYTVTGVLNLATGELIISGTYEGHHESVCDQTAVMPAGFQRWADTYEAWSWQDAEAQARADHHGVVWTDAGQLRDGDTVLVDDDSPARVVAGDPAVLQHVGRTEVVITFRGGGTWTVDASHQVKTV